MSAHSWFCSLADLNLDGVRRFQVLIGHAITIRHVFEYVFIGRFFFFRQNTALPAAHRRTSRRASSRQRDFGLFGERTEGHM